MYCGEACGSPGWVVESTFRSFLYSYFVVPPVFNGGRGEACFRFLKTTKIRYSLDLYKLKNVTSATLHLGKFPKNGPMVAVLCRSKEREKECQRKITGTLRKFSLKGPLKGEPISCLVEQMRLGNVYVLVRTLDSPNGALRGQVMLAHTHVLDFPPPWR